MVYLIDSYLLQVYVVAPTVYNTTLNFLHAILGTYVVLNIFGNFIAIIVVDSSTQGLVLPSQVNITGTAGVSVQGYIHSTCVYLDLGNPDFGLSGPCPASDLSSGRLINNAYQAYCQKCSINGGTWL